MKSRSQTFGGWLLDRLMVGFGAVGLTLVFFLVLPFMQAIGKAPDADTRLTSMDTTALPPPPPVIEEEPEEEPEPEEQPPELEENTELLDLSQLELALSPGFGEGVGGGDFAIQLDSGLMRGQRNEALFTSGDLDQPPRAIHRSSPTMTVQMRKKTPGAVTVLALVDVRGRIKNPIVQSSTDPVFEKAAVAAIKQWRYEPGKRNGEAVEFRIRQTITFPAG